MQVEIAAVCFQKDLTEALKIPAQNQKTLKEEQINNLVPKKEM